nr:hypothetical protein BaRGS_009997 [Batillaria attramentaria]
MRAAVLEDYNTIMHLVFYDADLDARRSDGTTALMLAVQHAECPVAAILLEAGARINDEDNQGETALIKAIKRGDKEMLKLILENGANYTVGKSAGFNAIQLAEEDNSIVTFKPVKEGKNELVICFNIGTTSSGNPAPRNPASHPASAARGSGKRGPRSGDELSLDQQTAHFVLNHAHLQQTNRENVNGRIVSQAARRLEHLQRVQHANLGLSSMDVRQPELPGKQFMLKGKPASAEVALLNRQRALMSSDAASIRSGRFGTGSTRGSSTRQNRPGKALSEPPNGLLHDRRAEVRSGHSNGTDPASTQTAPKQYPSPVSSYFVLAAPNTVHNTTIRSAPPVHTTHNFQSRHRQEQRQHAPGVGAGVGVAANSNRRPPQTAGAAFELTGHQVLTPRSNAGTDDMFTSRDYMNYPRSPRGTSRSAIRDYWSAVFKDRKSPGLKDNSVDLNEVDHQMLQECLHVQQTAHGVGHDGSGEAVKLKHYTKYVRSDPQHSHRIETKVNYNNPYRQSRTKERRVLPESAQRYIFDSVTSYIHFNKIYPQGKEPGSGAVGPAVNGAALGGFAVHAPRIPHLAGFPKHCTDTILLRMMFEMNRPGAIHGRSHRSAMGVPPPHKEEDEEGKRSGGGVKEGGGEGEGVVELPKGAGVEEKGEEEGGRDDEADDDADDEASVWNNNNNDENRAKKIHLTTQKAKEAEDVNG